MLNNIIFILLVKEILFLDYDVDVYDFKSNIYCGNIYNAELSFKINFQDLNMSCVDYHTFLYITFDSINENEKVPLEFECKTCGIFSRKPLEEFNCRKINSNSNQIGPYEMRKIDNPIHKVYIPHSSAFIVINFHFKNLYFKEQLVYSKSLDYIYSHNINRTFDYNNKNDEYLIVNINPITKNLIMYYNDKTNNNTIKIFFYECNNIICTSLRYKLDYKIFFPLNGNKETNYEIYTFTICGTKRYFNFKVKDS